MGYEHEHEEPTCECGCSLSNHETREDGSTVCHGGSSGIHCTEFHEVVAK